MGEGLLYVPAVWYICFSFYCNFDKSITPCSDKGPSWSWSYDRFI